MRNLSVRLVYGRRSLGIAPNSQLPDMKQKRAVEWLWNLSQTKELEASDFEQAIAMEKEQIMDAYNEGYHIRDSRGDLSYNPTAEQYYNETYAKL